MVANVARGMPAGDPNTHFQTMLGRRMLNNKLYGGAVWINGTAAVAPEWMRADAFSGLLNTYGGNIAKYAMTGNGRDLSAKQISRMSLVNAGGNRYYVAEGFDNQGRPKILRHKTSGGAYILDLDQFYYKVFKPQHPDWILRR